MPEINDKILIYIKGKFLKKTRQYCAYAFARYCLWILNLVYYNGVVHCKGHQ